MTTKTTQPEEAWEIEFDILKDYIKRIILSERAKGKEEAKREEREKLRQGMELWMDTHERTQKTFQTNDLIKFLFGGINENI
jgi:hypothetical protein